jgi:2-polyprenyl-6-methoxyphenol hydroxylase-like FAD-dependent oxidoreductase
MRVENAADEVPGAVGPMDRGGDHAVVIGASMAGLLGACSLAESHGRVTIVERDALPAVGEDRKAVPQGRHVHLLLPAGVDCLERLLPGLSDELAAAGANPFGPDELRFEIAGHRITREGDGDVSISASRPMLEGLVRRRVLALPEVEVMERSTVTGLEAKDGDGRVAGVRVKGQGRDAGGQRLDADLVLAASGRAGRVPAWLEELGYARPTEEKLPVELMYVTRRLRREPGALNGDKWVVIGARPGRPRTLVMSAVENDQWIVTLAGYGSEHHPPTDDEGFMDFALELAPPEVATTIRNAKPLGEIATHGFPANQRRRYETLDRLPGGLLVAGDAVASFNPLYGQGMTVAALEAIALRDCLREGRDGLERRFFDATAKQVDHAWQMAIGSDLALPEVDGDRPLRIRLLNLYIDRLMSVAERDPAVATAFRNVVGMLRPPTHIMRPSVAVRVLRG